MGAKRYTTLELEQTDNGAWRATQRDVDLAGRGKTAAEAAAHYCELVAGTSGPASTEIATDGGEQSE